MKILHVATEIYPLNKTGGLGDVVAHLPKALLHLGLDVRLLMPGFPVLMEALDDKVLVAQYPKRLGAGRIRLYQGTLKPHGYMTYLIDAPELYERVGNPYTDAGGESWGDNYLRFGLLGWMGARLSDKQHPLPDKWFPDVIHCHDWHAGMTPAYLKALPHLQKPQSLFTIHNLSFSGSFDPLIFERLELPHRFFSPQGLEFHGRVSFLKAGLYYADKLTTVSPTYAAEIQTSDYGCGFEGLLRYRAADLHGILNGVNYELWDPQRDGTLAVSYSYLHFDLKAKNKSALQKELGFPLIRKQPLLSMISRLSPQKGVGLLKDVLPPLLEMGVQVVILGTGDPVVAQDLKRLAQKNPTQFAFINAHDEVMAHRILAGADMLMMPSLFEPCGLTQLYALRYGTVPIVRRTGGLCDTVVDATPQMMMDRLATGFTFDTPVAAEFLRAIERAVELFVGDPHGWFTLARRGMKQDFGWSRAAVSYLDLYHTQLSLPIAPAVP